MTALGKWAIARACVLTIAQKRAYSLS